MADITQNFSQLLLTYGPGSMLDLPEHAVVVAGLQDWRYAGSNWRPVEEERLVALLRQQLGAKLSPTFQGLRHPPMFDEERRDANAPGVEVRLFPTWFLVDEPPTSSEDGGSGTVAPATEKRRRIIEFADLSVTNSGKLSYKGDAKKADVNPIRFVGACAKGHLQDIDWRFPCPSQWRPFLPQAAFLGRTRRQFGPIGYFREMRLRRHGHAGGSL